MRNTIKYEGSETEKFQNAVEDCKSYLGVERFDNIIAALRLEGKEGIPLKDFSLVMSVHGGITGFPVKAMYEYAFP